MDIGFVKNPERTVWYEFPPDPDVQVLIRYLPMDEQAEIERQAIVEVAEPVTGEKDDQGNPKERIVRRLDEKEYNRLVGRAAVRGWKGLKEGEKEFPYTPENCDLLMIKWAEFSQFVGIAAPRLRLLVEAERKLAEKKSGTTSGPEKTSPE